MVSYVHTRCAIMVDVARPHFCRWVYLADRYLRNPTLIHQWFIQNCRLKSAEMGKNALPIERSAKLRASSSPLRSDSQETTFFFLLKAVSQPCETQRLQCTNKRRRAAGTSHSRCRFDPSISICPPPGGTCDRHSHWPTLTGSRSVGYP